MKVGLPIGVVLVVSLVSLVGVVGGLLGDAGRFRVGVSVCRCPVWRAGMVGGVVVLCY